MTIQFRARNAHGFGITASVKPFQFPGGEWHLTAPDPAVELPTTATVHGADPADLVKLALWADYARSVGVEPVAHLPYLPAARADRGTPFGAKVYADLVNAIGLAEVVVFDPHSPVAPELIGNVRVVDSARIVRNTVFGRSGYTDPYVGIIAPDAGAVERAKRVADLARLPLFTASKKRDFDTGKILGIQAPEGLPEHGQLLVVDDICDGGGTFLGLAAAMGIPRERLSLWVSHGIFSGKANLLNDAYSLIYTTDSHPGARRDDVNATVVPLFPYLYR